MKHLKPTVLIILLHFFFEGNAQFTLRSGVNVSRLTNTQQNTVFKPVFLVEYELTSGWRYMRRRGTALLFAELYNTQKAFALTGNSVNVYGAGINYTYRFKRYPWRCCIRTRSRWLFRPYVKAALRSEFFKLEEENKLRVIPLPYVAAGSLIGLIRGNRIEIEAGFSPMLYPIKTNARKIQSMSGYVTLSIPLLPYNLF